MKVLSLDGLTQLVTKTKELINTSVNNGLESAKEYTDAKFAQVDVNYNIAGSDFGLVKSGGDVSISDGIITINDDSHAHVISNIDGLQSALDGKALSSHTHNYAGSSSPGGAATSAENATKADTVDGFHVSSSTGNYLRPINYGTSALTPGTSSLTTGYIYIQYE